MIRLTLFQKLKIYNKTYFPVYAEILIIFGAINILTSEEKSQFIGLAMVIIGAVVILFKIRKLLKMVLIIKRGKTTKATIIDISNTNFEHNDRIVKKYVFEYKVHTQKLKFIYKSAYNRKLKLNQVLDIYFLPNQPKEVFIPNLYEINI